MMTIMAVVIMGVPTHLSRRKKSQTLYREISVNDRAITYFLRHRYFYNSNEKDDKKGK